MSSCTFLARAVRPWAFVLAAAAGIAYADAPTPVTSDQFLPGWQDHLRPLFFRGPSHLDPARDVWTLYNAPGAGRYVLVIHKGDKVELMPGYQFRTSADPFEVVHILLPPGSGDVEALPVEYVPKALRGSDTHDVEP